MSACVKYISNYGIPVFEIVAARALVSLIISYIDVKRKGISIWGNNKPLLFVRGAVGTAALMCVLLRCNHSSVGRSNYPAIRSSSLYRVARCVVPERTRPEIDHDLHCILPSGIIGDGSAKHEQRCEQRITTI